MTKTVSLNDYTYSELAVLAGKLSIIAKKPISLGMAISLATSLLDAALRHPGAEKEMRKVFSEVSTRMFTPEEFDIYWDELFKMITEQNKDKKRES